MRQHLAESVSHIVEALASRHHSRPASQGKRFTRAFDNIEALTS